MPRISISVSDEFLEYLEETAAAEKRSLSSEASLLMEQSLPFLGWKAMKKHMAKEVRK